jgi:hypothetical protein
MDTEQMGTSQQPVILDKEEECTEDTRAPKRLCFTPGSTSSSLLQFLAGKLSSLLNSGDNSTVESLRKTIE